MLLLSPVCGVLVTVVVAEPDEDSELAEELEELEELLEAYRSGILVEKA